MFLAMARKPRAPSTRPKKPPSPLKLEVRKRLRAVQEEIGKTDDQMAEMLKCSRSAWSNWVNLGPEMPAEEAMIELCIQSRHWRLTLDWIYRGIHGEMPVNIAIRLSARVLGLDPETATATVLDAV